MAATERMVREQKRAAALMVVIDDAATFTEAASRIACAELEREGRLVHALRCASSGHEFSAERETCICAKCGAWRAVAAYEAEFAPPQRTVEQIARDLVATRATFKCTHSDGHPVVAEDLLDELSAALKKGGA